MSSPFGTYAPVVAALVAVALVAGYVVSLLVPGVDPAAADRLWPLVLIAVSTIFGSALAVNGYRGPLTSLHSRVDRLSQAVTATAVQAKDVDAAAVTAIIDGPAAAVPSALPPA